MNTLSYFAPAIFLFTIHIAMEAFRADVLPYFFKGIITNTDSSSFLSAFVYTMDFMYVILMGSMIFLSINLAHNNVKFKPYLYFISTVLGLFQVIVFILLAVDLIRSTQNQSSCIY